jgi:hypothetical protein
MISSIIKASAIARSQDFPVRRMGERLFPRSRDKAAIATRTAATTTAADKPPLQLDQTAPGSVRHGFRAANDIHLGEDRFHVRFHGAFADEQRGADLLVAFSLGH